jgi:hypothetical protein
MRWRIIIAFLLMLTCKMVFAQTSERLMDIAFKDLPLDIVLDTISSKSDYNFSYNAEILPEGSLFSLSRSGISLPKLLDFLFVGTSLEYTIIDNQVIVRKQAKTEPAALMPAKPPKGHVTGWVRTYTDKMPMHGVNVFVNGTTIGAITDIYGNYRLPELDAGNHLLVFSHVGYEMIAYPLEVKDGQAFRVNGLMNEKINELKGVEIHSNPLVDESQFAKYLKLFTKEFIGRSSNASKCSIYNPEVLDFGKDDEGNLSWVEASEPILMINMSLGYRVTFELEYFEMEEKETNFYVKARFENIQSENNRDRKKWKKNRLKTYRGSAQHFFKALIADRIEEEDFEMYFQDETGRDSVMIDRASVLQKNVSNLWSLNLSRPLAISYKRELESLQYLKDAKEVDDAMMFFFQRNQLMHEDKPKFQRSVLNGIEASSVKLDISGKVLEPKNLAVRGYWSWERMADLMPIDYNPRTDNL